MNFTVLLKLKKNSYMLDPWKRIRHAHRRIESHRHPNLKNNQICKWKGLLKIQLTHKSLLKLLAHSTKLKCKYKEPNYYTWKRHNSTRDQIIIVYTSIVQQSFIISYVNNFFLFDFSHAPSSDVLNLKPLSKDDWLLTISSSLLV